MMHGQEGMMDGMGDMTWAMGLFCVLLIVILVLVIAVLVKRLFPRKS